MVFLRKTAYKEEIFAKEGKFLLSQVESLSDRVCTVSLGRAPLRMSVMPVSAGRETVTTHSYDWYGLKRGSAPFALIQHTISGAGRLRAHGRDFTLRRGETMLLTFPDDNRYWLPQGGSWTFFWMCLNGRETMRVMGDLIASRGPVQRFDAQVVDLLAGHCLNLMAGRHRTPMDASAETYACIMAMSEAMDENRRRTQTKSRDGLAAAEAHISANLQSRLSLDDLAEIAGYSRYHFCRAFRAAYGLTPAAYLHRARLALAARMLQSGSSSVKQVSHACGFSDPNYFSKCFRKGFGVSPTAFLNAGPTQRGIILQAQDPPEEERLADSDNTQV